MKPTIVMDWYLHPEAQERLAQECRLIPCPPGAEGIEVVRREKALAAIVGSHWRFDGPALDQMPSLLVVGRPGIGMDNIDLVAASDRGVAVVNTPDGPTMSTAEHAVSLLLALAKKHKVGARVLVTGTALTEPPLIELEGQALGLVGLGRIGKRVAHICGTGLGMVVVAYDPYIPADEAARLGVRLYSELDEILRIADFLSLHCPVTDTTRGLIDARALALMKPTANLINCARGAIVKEAALIRALQAGTIAGAGLDVFDPEPPSPSNPLLAMENVVATPHSAGFTEGGLRKMGLAVVEETLDVLRGVRPANLVNPEVWDAPQRRRPT